MKNIETIATIPELEMDDLQPLIDVEAQAGTYDSRKTSTTSWSR